MKIIRKKPNESGAYPSPQDWNDNAVPSGYAIVPDTLDFSEFYSSMGFVTLSLEDDIVVSFSVNTEELYAQQVADAPTPTEQRKAAYATLPCIAWEDRQITVDAANLLWMAYSAEGSAKADELHTLISVEKEKIRAMYPDVNI